MRELKVCAVGCTEPENGVNWVGALSGLETRQCTVPRAEVFLLDVCPGEGLVCAALLVCVSAPSRSGAGPSALPVGSLPPVLERVVETLTAMGERWWENGGPAVPELSCQSLTIWCLCCHKAFSCAVLCLSSGYGAAEQSPPPPAPTLLLLLSILRSHRVQKQFCALLPTSAWPTAAALCLPLCPDALACAAYTTIAGCSAALLHRAVKEKLRMLLPYVYILKKERMISLITARHSTDKSPRASFCLWLRLVPFIYRRAHSHQELWDRGHSAFIVVFDLNVTDGKSFGWQRIMFSDSVYFSIYFIVFEWRDLDLRKCTKKASTSCPVLHSKLVPIGLIRA